MLKRINAAALILAALNHFSSGVAVGQAPLQLSIEPPSSNGWVQVHSSIDTPDRVFTLLASSNLLTWSPVATLHHGPFLFPDPASVEEPNRFYTLTNAPKSAADDWKNQITLPDEPFATGNTGSGQPGVQWIKFAILTDEPNRVYYQDSNKYPFHFDFARTRLAPFHGMSREAFDRVSLRATNQQAVLGALLLPAGGRAPEYGIQFVGLDPYPRETIARWFELVRSTVAAPPGVEAFYIPNYEQARVAKAEQPYFESKGIRVASVERWGSGNRCYAPGWALGRLQFITAAEISAAYADGRLHPADILLTDSVPSEIPYVAGVIALEPSTPNSHVAILARSHGLPFVYLAGASEQDRVRQLAGQPILLRVAGEADGCESKVVPLSSSLDPELKAEILRLKTTPALDIVPKASFGAFSSSVDALIPADIQFFGGKAANFGVLRRSIPNDSPPAIAFSFDLWDEFLAQVMPGGKTLQAEIAGRLAKYTYPADVAALRADLDAIRTLITGQAQFTAPQQQAILAAVSVFPSDRKVRFRSSTNVEDSERFSGAGLYDSYSGCPADDLDTDSQGPSHCDPTQSNERGVFRAIKRVYASFYNENAVLERLRFGIDESKAGMAVLVHLSTPDEIELANGVATLQITGNILQGELVTQAGAVSVTNPDTAAQPEVVSVSKFSFGTFLDLKHGSSLVPLGGHVLVWEEEYQKLVNLLVSAADEYRKALPAKTNLALNFEYKKIAPGFLSIKQIREVPSSGSDQHGPTYLLNEPGSYCVFQGEFGDVFANHRLKSRWSLQTRDLALVETNLVRTLYTDTAVEFVAGSGLQILTNGTSSWPGADFALADSIARDRWTLEEGPDRKVFTLETSISPEFPAIQSPVVTVADFFKVLRVDYSRPMPVLDFDGKPATTTSESVRLWRCPEITSESLLQERTFKSGEVNIHTRFYWPKPPTGFTAGYTAPLQAWVETSIEGLTQQPIRLLGSYSQTYRPEHHNFGENFIFEPQLEPGIAPDLLAELAAANIRLIHVYWSDNQVRISILGLDNQFRSLPAQ